MRIARLGLVRYGRFTDRVLDFGPKPDGPDLHLVYGPNEAGKSTTLSAWLDLLYGIGMQSPYNFLHPYGTMRIEAELEFDGAPRRFARIKRPQASLLDGADQPLPDAAILAELGGIGRDAYRAMFSLDEETLEAGGESILASRGDLGQLLFSASAGLAALTRRLDALKAGADAFHKPRAHRTGLSELKSRLAELREARGAIDTLATDYHRLVAEESAARAAYQQAIGERGAVRARLEAVGRITAALPRLDALATLAEDRAALAHLPEPPPGFADALPDLQRLEIELTLRDKALTEEAASIAADRERLAEDPTALALADRFAALADLAARDRSGAKDLPERRLQQAEADRAVAALLARIGRPDDTKPADLIVGATEAAGLSALIDARSGIETALGNARAERKASSLRLAEAEAELAAAAGNAAMPPPEALSELRATLTLVRSEDPEGRRARARDEAARLETRLGEALALLAPWQGDGQALAALIAPGAAMLADWRSRRTQAEAALAQYGADCDRLANEAARLEAEAGSLAARTAAGVADAALAARQARDAAWTAHRATLDAEGADRFEAAMRRDDAATLARLAHVAEEARRAELASSLAIVTAEAHRAATLRAEAADRLAAIEATIRAAAEAIAPGLAATTGLDGLGEWLDRRERALEAHGLAAEARRAVGSAEAAVAAASARLAAALGRAGAEPAPETPLAALVAHADDLVERSAALAADRAQLNDRKREQAARLAAEKEAEAAEAAWQADWRAALAATWLGRNGAELSTGAVRDILAALGALSPALEKAAGLADRIAKMEHDRAAYAEAIGSLAATLDMPAEADVGLLASRIAARIEAARLTAERRADLDARMAANAAARARLQTEAAELSRQRDALTGFFGVSTLAEVAASLAGLAERRRLDEAAEAARRDIRAALEAPSFAAAEAALVALDRSALAAERIALKQQAEDLDLHCQKLFAAMTGAEARLSAIGGDGAVAAIEAERRTVLVEIEDRALAYLRLSAGIAAAETAIRLYRERHRSGMMARASEAFRTVSRGAYTGLAAEAAKDGERLIALAAAGGSREADELSKGTRFQLYLALRVAGYHEFAASRPAVPFVADDIMESFDDFRAEEAFRLFAGMAEVGQVIYLTHHRHLIPIAEKISPSIRIHRLGQD